MRTVRIGFNKYFIQYTGGIWWQWIFRFGNRGLVINRTYGIFTRKWMEK